MKMKLEAMSNAAWACLARANEIARGYNTTESTLRRAELNIQLAHAYLRYIEVAIMEGKA